MLTVIKVARAVGVSTATIKKYEAASVIPASRRWPINGYRIWTEEDLVEIKAILGPQATSKLGLED